MADFTYYTDITGDEKLDNAVDTFIKFSDCGQFTEALGGFMALVKDITHIIKNKVAPLSMFAETGCFYSKASFNAGLCLYKMGRYDEAEQCFVGALDFIKANIYPIAYEGEKRTVVIKIAKALAELYGENKNDAVHSAQYMQEAACCYDDEAMKNVAEYYKKGYGVPKSERVARIWENISGYSEFARKYIWENYFKLDYDKLMGINPQGGKMSQDVIIPYGVTTVVKMPDLANVIVPPTVKVIRSDAARVGKNHVVVFTGPVEQIGEGAFKMSMLLEEVYLPHTVGVIERSAFDSCRKLTRIELPCVSLDGLGICAISGCTSLDGVVLNAKAIKFVDGSAFLSTDARITVRGTEKDTERWSEYWSLYRPGDYHYVEYVK